MRDKVDKNILSLRFTKRVSNFDIDINCELPTDGITSVFGPSGSGKTTLLRMIAGFEAPASGQIIMQDKVWYDDQNSINVAAHRRGVGFVFQDVRLFGHLNVRNNLSYAWQRCKNEQQRFLYDDVIYALDLRPLLERRVTSLSGGERQRVALGRSLLSQPCLLLLDEPLSALDMKRKAEILPFLSETLRRFQIFTIYVSHAVEEVAQLADHILMISKGRVQAFGSASCILQRPEFQSITDRLARENEIHVRVTAYDQNHHIAFCEFEGQTLSVPLPVKRPVGEVLSVCIHPADILIATQRPQNISAHNIIEGQVDDILWDEDLPYADVYVAVGRSRLKVRLMRSVLSELKLKTRQHAFVCFSKVKLA